MRSSSLIPRLPADESLAVAQINAVLTSPPKALPWSFVRGATRLDESGACVDSWTTDDEPGLSVEFVRDTSLRLRWISVIHPDDECRDAVLRKISDLIPDYSLQELLDDGGSCLPRATRAVAAALSLNSRFNAEVLAWIEMALQDPDDEMRANAAIAAALLLWPQLVLPLESAVHCESDDGVAGVMEAALAAIRSSAPFDTHAESR